MGVNPLSAVTTARATSRPVKDADKAKAFGGTLELIISKDNRAFFKNSGAVVTLTNVAPAVQQPSAAPPQPPASPKPPANQKAS
jgi:hypothetical protein